MLESTLESKLESGVEQTLEKRLMTSLGIMGYPPRSGKQYTYRLRAAAKEPAREKNLEMDQEPFGGTRQPKFEARSSKLEARSMLE